LPSVDQSILLTAILTGIMSCLADDFPLAKRSVFAMPIYAIVMSIVAGILDILGVTLLLIETFSEDYSN
jgi:hypothetical protein